LRLLRDAAKLSENAAAAASQQAVRLAPIARQAGTAMAATLSESAHAAAVAANAASVQAAEGARVADAMVHGFYDRLAAETRRTALRAGGVVGVRAPCASCG
jgi:hypothetical protein